MFNKILTFQNEVNFGIFFKKLHCALQTEFYLISIVNSLALFFKS